MQFGTDKGTSCGLHCIRAIVELEMVPRIWSSPHSALDTALLLVYTGTTAGVCLIYTSVGAERADGVMIQALEGQLRWPFAS